MLTDLGRVALVVDDEHFARLFAAQILLDVGFVVVEAEKADEAVAQLRDNEDVSLVLTDIAMPGAEDGLALASHVGGVRPDLPLIIASGLPAPSGFPDSEKLRFLPKPYTASALVTQCPLDQEPVGAGVPPVSSTMFGG